MGSRRYSNLTNPELSASTGEESPTLAFLGSTLQALPAPAPAGFSMPAPNRLIRAMQTARRRRGAFFPGDLFADPAWDILLELYARHLEGQRITVSALCLAAHVPATTALRWIGRLEETGLAIRQQDHTDGRRFWMELSPTGLEGMRRFVEAFGPASV
jgi:DNA-binding MarR family transcriptional regulator